MPISLDVNLLAALVREVGLLSGVGSVDESKITTALNQNGVPQKDAEQFMARLRLLPAGRFVAWGDAPKAQTEAFSLQQATGRMEDELAASPWGATFRDFAAQYGINGGYALEALFQAAINAVLAVGVSLTQSSGEVPAQSMISGAAEVVTADSLNTPYVNSIPVDQEAQYPQGLELDQEFENAVRWNAAVTVDGANRRNEGLGGHIATYQSAATLYEVLLNHFLTTDDHIYVQGHSSPGIYARAYLEGVLTKEQLEHFRQEVDGKGLPSYPHAWRLPNFWNNATVSMGLGPIAAIMQARFNRYLQTRGIKDTSKQKVWAFLGDGEMDEPESRGALQIANRDKLDNLVFVINCNLQRLDSPVRANSSIIQELEGSFKGNGWNVIKVMWGTKWDPLFAADTNGALLKRISEITDGQWQNYGAWSVDKVRADFIGENEDLKTLFADYSDEDFSAVMNDRGGHDPRKVYAAYKQAMESTGKPTVILAQTIKGRSLATNQAALGAHNAKKMGDDEVAKLARTLNIPVEVPSDHEALAQADLFYKPSDEVIAHARERREALGGSYFGQGPKNTTQLTIQPGALVAQAAEKLAGADLSMSDYLYRLFYTMENGPMFNGTKLPLRSTTMAYSKMMGGLLKDKAIGKNIVPIIPDEGRTFGWDALFQNPGVWDAQDQTYGDRTQGGFTNYRVGPKWQVMQEGINEAGAMATFIAASTAYRAQGVPTIPFYIFYSMFGLQRTMDQWWQNADMRGRGFLIGATFGRTTLNGEGTQHQDGHSLLLASTIPQLRAYDPAFAYEMAMIVEEGVNEMYGTTNKDGSVGRDVTYYVTSQNENYLHPELPTSEAEQARIRHGVKKGMYHFHSNADEGAEASIDLFGSGSIMIQVLKAQKILKDLFNIASNVFSVTSYSELAKEAAAIKRYNTFNPEKPQLTSYLESLTNHNRAIVAVSDSIRAVQNQVLPCIKGDRFKALGTDGMGLSDTREKLRDHFEISAEHIAYQAMESLHRQGRIELSQVVEARTKLQINPDKPNPVGDPHSNDDALYLDFGAQAVNDDAAHVLVPVLAGGLAVAGGSLPMLGR